MSEGDDLPEYTGPLAPSAEGDYLSAAANWLALAEQDTQTWQDFRVGMQDRTDARMAVTVYGRLAELNISMATACGGYQDRQPRTELAPPGVKAMGEELAEKLAADQAAYEAVRLTGTDPEPESTDGDLWIDTAPLSPDWSRFLYKLGPDRWAWAASHARTLGYRRSDGTEWSRALGTHIVRRPTAGEREEFYAPPEPWCECCASGLMSGRGETCDECDHGPEGHATESKNGAISVQRVATDTAPTPPEHACGQFDTGDSGTHPITRSSICERCGASAAAHIQVGLRHLAEVGAGPIPVRHVQAEERRKAVQALSDQEFEDMLTLAEEERLRRQRENGVAIQPRRQHTPPGTPGATQWNG